VELSCSVGRSHKRDQQGGTGIVHLDTVVVGSASCEGDRASIKSDANDSQVGILPGEVDRHPPPSRPLSGGIMRTDLVTVTTSTYEADADRNISVSRWD
jgi:hypothetical protein